jgi:hypothetical protein
MTIVHLTFIHPSNALISIIFLETTLIIVNMSKESRSKEKKIEALI